MSLNRRYTGAGERGSFFGVTMGIDDSGFEGLLRRVSPQGLLSILNRYADLIVTEAQLIVPVRTGRLRDSIRVEIQKQTDTQVSVRIVAGNTTVYYAPFVEFGTAKTKAKPYIRPAYDKVIEEEKEHIATDFAKLLLGSTLGPVGEESLDGHRWEDL